MHKGNQDWLRSLSKKYPGSFKKSRVLEIGSLEWNGSVRKRFSSPIKYIGVDIVAGPGVDVVAKAAETVFQEGEFDTLVCLSLFEHDPDWRRSFQHNLKWLKPGGMAFVCWGAEGNKQHLPEPWAIVPVQDFVDASKSWPVQILDAFFEGTRFTPDCPGCYDVVLQKR
jgi:SAM-dependent methyltransferase